MIIDPYRFAAAAGGGLLTGIVSIEGSLSDTSGPARYGWRFTVGASDIDVEELRVRSTFAGGHTEDVRIHRVSDAALIAQADVVMGSDKAEWLTAAITPVTLAASAQYTITARPTGGESRTFLTTSGGATFADEITFDTTVYGTGDTMPTSTTGAKYIFTDIGFSL